MQASIWRKEVMTSVISPAERIPFPNHHYLMAEHNGSTHRLTEHMSLWTNCPGQAASNGSTGFRLLCERKARAETHMEKAAAITVRYRGSLQPRDPHFPGCNRQWCLKKHTHHKIFIYLLVSKTKVQVLLRWNDYEWKKTMCGIMDTQWTLQSQETQLCFYVAVTLGKSLHLSGSVCSSGKRREKSN